MSMAVLTINDEHGDDHHDNAVADVDDFVMTLMVFTAFGVDAVNGVDR